MFAEHFTQGRVQKMGSGMVAGSLASFLQGDTAQGGVVFSQATTLHLNLVEAKITDGTIDVFYGSPGGVIVKDSFVGNLATGLGVKRSSIQDDLSRLSRGQFLHQVVALKDGQNMARDITGLGISGEFRGQVLLGEFLIDGFDFLFPTLPTGPGSFTLFLHLSVKALFIHFQLALCGNLLSQIEREPIGVIETKKVFTRQYPLALLGDPFTDLVQKFHPVIKRAAEFLLLVFHDFGRVLTSLQQFGISIFHEITDQGGERIEKWIGGPQHLSVTHGPSENFSEHITSAFVSGHDSIVDEKGTGPAVVS